MLTCHFVPRKCERSTKIKYTIFHNSFFLMFLFHLGNHCWLSKAHFINSTVWCDCLFSKLEDQEAPSIDQTVEALILSPILNISCSHDVKLSEPAKTRVPLTLSDGGIEPMDLNAGQLKILHFNSSEKSQEWTDITDDLDMLAVLKDRKVKNFCP